MPQMQREFKIRKLLAEVKVLERPVQKKEHKGYRGEKIIQKTITDIGPRFRFCYYVYTPSGRKVFGQYAPEYRENDLLRLLKMAIDKNMFSKKFISQLKIKLSKKSEN